MEPIVEMLHRFLSDEKIATVTGDGAHIIIACGTKVERFTTEIIVVENIATLNGKEYDLYAPKSFETIRAVIDEWVDQVLAPHDTKIITKASP